MSPSISIFGAALGADSDPRILQLNAKFKFQAEGHYSGGGSGLRRCVGSA